MNKARGNWEWGERVTWLDRRSRNVLVWSESVFGRGPYEGSVCWLRMRVGQNSGTWGGENLNRSLVNKHFILMDQWGPSSSDNYLWGNKWWFGGSLSGLVIDEQGRHPWVSSTSHGEGWFCAVSHMLEHKIVGECLAKDINSVCCFLASQGLDKVKYGHWKNRREDLN